MKTEGTLHKCDGCGYELFEPESGGVSKQYSYKIILPTDDLQHYTEYTVCAKCYDALKAGINKLVSQAKAESAEKCAAIMKTYRESGAMTKETADKTVPGLK